MSELWLRIRRFFWWRHYHKHIAPLIEAMREGGMPEYEIWQRKKVAYRRAAALGGTPYDHLRDLGNEWFAENPPIE